MIRFKMKIFLKGLIVLHDGEMSGGYTMERYFKVKEGAVFGLQLVFNILKYLFPDRKISADFSFTEPVYGDPDRISQLASNLLANAFTHGNPESPVWFAAGNHNDEMTLSVANDGEPIPESLQKILFTLFKRESDRPSKNGLGLGLYIANQIALAHGGTLAFTSDEKETRFTFTMSAKK